MQNCPGWAMSGGPWITPDNAMRHLVWSRKDIHGGEKHIVSAGSSATQPRMKTGAIIARWRCWRFPRRMETTANGYGPLSSQQPEDAAWSDVFAGKKEAEVRYRAGQRAGLGGNHFRRTGHAAHGGIAAIAGFNEQSVLRDPDMTYYGAGVLPAGCAKWFGTKCPRGNWQDTGFPYVLAVSGSAPRRTIGIAIRKQAHHGLVVLQPFGGGPVKDWRGQAALRAAQPGSRGPIRSRLARHVIRSADRGFDGQMDAKGQSAWNAPPGRWTVVRCGHVNTGAKNSPAPPEATGWECDKLSPAGAELISRATSGGSQPRTAAGGRRTDAGHVDR